MSQNQSWWSRLFRTGSLIAISKVFGFIRDQLITAFLGTSFRADAFNYACLFTSYPFILLGGLNGPFHSATIASLGEESDETQRRYLLGQIIFWSLIVFGFLSLGLFIFIRPIVEFGFSDHPSLINEIVLQSQIMLPCVLFTGIIGVLFGAVCYQGRYSAPSISPLISNIALIIITVLFYNVFGALALGIGTSFGVLGQVIFQFLQLRPSLYLFSDLSELFKMSRLKYFSMMLCPALLSSTIGSLNVYIDMFFCKDLVEGSWTAIVLSNRLIQLPFGILVGGALVSFLPKITSLKENIQKFRESISKELYNLFLLLVPVTAILLALPEAIIEILFQRGEFNQQSTQLVGMALFFIGFSLCTSLPREILTRAFYGLGDSKTPFIISLISIGVNFLLNYILVKYFAVGGIAMSTTLTALINSILLTILLKDRFYCQWLGLAKVFVGGAATYITTSYIFQHMQQLSILDQINVIPNLLNLHTVCSASTASIGGLAIYIIIIWSCKQLKNSTPKVPN